MWDVVRYYCFFVFIYCPDSLYSGRERKGKHPYIRRWVGHVTRMMEKRNAFKMLIGKPDGKRPLGRPRRRLNDNIKLYLGVQLSPFCTAATNRSIVPAPGDYDDGEIGGMIGKGNRITRRKPAPMPQSPNHKPHMLPGRETGPPRWEARTNRLSYGTA
jgi:hypothetical protein